MPGVGYESVEGEILANWANVSCLLGINGQRSGGPKILHRRQ